MTASQILAQILRGVTGTTVKFRDSSSNIVPPRRKFFACQKCAVGNEPATGIVVFGFELTILVGTMEKKRRNRIKQTTTLTFRLIQLADAAHARAAILPPGPERERMMKKARSRARCPDRKIGYDARPRSPKLAVLRSRTRQPFPARPSCWLSPVHCRLRRLRVAAVKALEHAPLATIVIGAMLDLGYAFAARPTRRPVGGSSNLESCLIHSQRSACEGSPSGVVRTLHSVRASGLSPTG